MIEDVKKILEHLRVMDDIDSSSYQSGINREKNLEHAIQKICQLFEPHDETMEAELKWRRETTNNSPKPKPDEGRLLTEEDIRLELARILLNFEKDDSSFSGTITINNIMGLIAKTASIKEAECQERVKRIVTGLLALFRYAYTDGDWKDSELENFLKEQGVR